MMATSSPLLLLFFAAPLLLAPRPPWASADPFVLIDALDFNAVGPGNEMKSNAEAGNVSSTFIAAESKALATSAAYPGETRMWDFSDADSEGEEGLGTSVRRERETVNALKASSEGQVVSEPLDALLDFALKAIVHQIGKHKSSEIPLPKFEKEFFSRIGFIKIPVHLETSPGTVGDFTSLFRDGHVRVRKGSWRDLVFEGAVGLRNLRVRFGRYTARVGPKRVSGTMEAHISPAIVRGQLVLSPPCSVDLRSVVITKMGELDLRLTGPGPFKLLFPLIKRWIVKKVREDVERLIVRHVSKLVSKELNKLCAMRL